MKASSFKLRPATTDRRLSETCLESLEFKSLSISKTIEMGVGSTPKYTIFCSTLSSKIRNSSRRRSATSFPDPSFTVTGTTTWLTGIMILPCLFCCGGASGFCCGAVGVAPCWGAWARSWISGTAISIPQTTRTVFRRLFIVLKPDFVLNSSARLISVTHPSHHFAASYRAAMPRGLFPAGQLSQRKVYMRSMHKLLMQCATATVAVILAMPGMPQEPAAQGGTIKTQVNLVNLFATVRDKNKRLIADLKQDNFKIQEDNQEQKIAFFSKEVALPITLALLLDTSGSEQFMLGAIQDAGSSFLHRILRKGDEALVMSFDSDVDLLSDFTDDRAQLDRAVRKARINIPGGGSIGGNPGPVGSRQITGTALYDAIYLACGEKLNSEAGRKAVVIVTDADDQGSKVRIEEAIEAAQRTDTVIHVILVADPRYGANTGAAKKLAEETGGRVLNASSEKKLMEAFDEISAELRSQYTLGFYSSNLERDGKFRKIKVETVNHDLKVLARKGYYAPKG